MVLNQDGTVDYGGTPEMKPLLTTWNCQLAFIDFECSVKYDLTTDPRTWMTKETRGTPPYTPPEKGYAYTSGAEYQALPADVCHMITFSSSSEDHLHRCMPLLVCGM